MRFLVDAQLPPALARWLQSHAHDADHVVDLALERAPDGVIWNCAVTSGAVIVTKDEDFVQRRVLAKTGPTVVWLRIGNTRRRTLLTWFESVFPAIVLAIERGETLIELHPQ